jgi:hypothetical protein
MLKKSLLLAAGAAFAAFPSIAAACEPHASALFHRIPRRLDVGAGVNIEPGDYNVMIAAAQVGIGIVNRLAVVPHVGFCTESAPAGEEDFSAAIFGASAALRLWTSSDDKITINVQTGLNTYSDQGYKETTIPFMAAAEFLATQNLGVFGGAGIISSKESFDGFEDSDSDPVIMAGVNVGISAFVLTGGIRMKMGDEDTDTSFNLAFRVPIGSR